MNDDRVWMLHEPSSYHGPHVSAAGPDLDDPNETLEVVPRAELDKVKAQRDELQRIIDAMRASHASREFVKREEAEASLASLRKRADELAEALERCAEQGCQREGHLRRQEGVDGREFYEPECADEAWNNVGSSPEWCPQCRASALTASYRSEHEDTG